jgi:hypothetical protein
MSSRMPARARRPGVRRRGGRFECEIGAACRSRGPTSGARTGPAWAAAENSRPACREFAPAVAQLFIGRLRCWWGARGHRLHDPRVLPDYWHQPDRVSQRRPVQARSPYTNQRAAGDASRALEGASVGPPGFAGLAGSARLAGTADVSGLTAFATVPRRRQSPPTARGGCIRADGHLPSHLPAHARHQVACFDDG